MNRTQPLSVDGMYRARPLPQRRAAPLQKRVIPAPQPRPPKAAPARAYATPAQKQVRRKRRVPGWLQILLAVPMLMFTSLFIQSAVLGQAAIVAYGLAAFIWRVPSKTTFTAALLSMVVTIILLVAKGDLNLAQNFATYTFLLLVVGVLTLSRELKKEGGRIYSRRPT